MADDENSRLINTSNGHQSNGGNFWSRSSSKRKGLLILGLVALVSVVVVVSITTTMKKKHESEPISPEPSPEPVVCHTNGCNESSRLIIENMDENIDPCYDFYDFACGNFNKYNPIPKERQFVGLLDNMQRDVDNKVMTILDQLTKSDSRYSESKSIRYVKDMYDMCVDELVLEKNGVAPLKKLVNGLAGWSSSLSSEGFLYKLAKFIGRSSSQYSMDSVILSVYVAPHNFSPRRNVIHIDQPSFAVDKKMLLRSFDENDQEAKAVMTAFQFFINQTAEVLGSSDISKNDYAMNITSFERRLANISLTDEERGVKSGSGFENNTLNITLGELKSRKILGNELQDFLITILAAAGVTGKDPRDADEIIIHDYEYVKHIKDILDSTNDNILESYLGLRIIMRYAFLSTLKMRHNMLNFTQITTGVKSLPNHKNSCLELVSRVFPSVLGRLYVDQHSSETKVQEESANLIKQVITTLKESVSQQKWFDDITKKTAIEKLEKMKVNTAFPSWIKDNKELDRLHKFPILDNPTAVMKLYRAYETLASQSFKSLHEEVDWEKNWPSHPTVVSASYIQRQNSFSVPESFLQEVLYSLDKPSYLNYGSLGVIASHEVSHAVDYKFGSNYDEFGSLKKWYSPEAVINFDKKGKCFEEQYSSITDEQTLMKLDGRKTLAENLAQNAGIKIAFDVFKKNSAEKEQYLLPGLSKYTTEQMFFINYANIWCFNARYDYVREQIMTSDQSLGRYQVNVPLMNSPEFSRIFSCKQESKMNPEKKCSLW